MSEVDVLRAIALQPESKEVLDTVCAALDAGVPIASAQEPLKALALLIAAEDPAVEADENALYLTLSVMVGELRRRHRELN